MVIGVGINLFRAGVLGGDAGVALGVGSALAQILAFNPEFFWSPTHGSAGFVGTSGGALPVPGDPLGLLIELSQLEGKTQAEWLASAPELATVTTQVGVAIGGPGFTSYTISGDLVAGKVYEVSCQVTGYSGSSSVGVGSSSTTATAGVPTGVRTISSNGQLRFVMLAAFSTTIALFTRDVNTCTFTNISIKELPGNHPIAGTWATPVDASRAMYGRVPRTGRRNLLTRTEEFDNAAWTKVNATVTANAAVAPDGTTTAAVLSDVSAAGQPALFQAQNIPTGAIDYSWYVKKAPGSAADWVTLRIVDGGNSKEAFVNLTTGAVGSVSAGGTATVTVLDNGWLRISHNRAAPDSTAAYSCRLSPAVANSNNAWTGTGAATLHFWHPQLEPGSTATAYQRVTTALDVTESGVPDTFYLDPNATANAYSFLSALSARTVIARVRVPTGWSADDRFLTNDAESVNISTGGVADDAPELVTNSDFSDGTTGWAAHDPGNGGAISVVSGQLVGSSATVSNIILRNATAISTVVGRAYVAEIDVLASNKSTSIYVGTFEGLANLSNGSFASGVGKRRAFFTATTTTTWLSFVGGSAIATATVDNFSVKELSPLWTNTGSGTTRINGASGTAFAVDTWQTLTLEYASAQAFSRLWFSATGSQFGSMDLACLAVFDGALSAGDRATAETIVTATA